MHTPSGIIKTIASMTKQCPQKKKTDIQHSTIQIKQPRCVHLDVRNKKVRKEATIMFELKRKVKKWRRLECKNLWKRRRT